MNENQRESNRKSVSRYREKLSANKKRIEFWLDEPAALKELQQQSGRNQTEVLNLLVGIVSDGLSIEFYRNESERLHNEKFMLQQLIETFGV